MSVTRKMRMVQALTVVYVVLFSLPMLFIWYTPMWTYTYHYDRPVALPYFLRLLAFVFSPYAFLIMGIICYRKGLRLRTYIATVLFIWAVQIQISLFLFSFILDYFPRYFQHFP